MIVLRMRCLAITQRLKAISKFVVELHHNEYTWSILVGLPVSCRSRFIVGLTLTGHNLQLYETLLTVPVHGHIFVVSSAERFLPVGINEHSLSIFGHGHVTSTPQFAESCDLPSQLSR